MRYIVVMIDTQDADQRALYNLWYRIRGTYPVFTNQKTQMYYDEMGMIADNYPNLYPRWWRADVGFAAPDTITHIPRIATRLLQNVGPNTKLFMRLEGQEYIRRFISELILVPYIYPQAGIEVFRAFAQQLAPIANQYLENHG